MLKETFGKLILFLKRVTRKNISLGGSQVTLSNAQGFLMALCSRDHCWWAKGTHVRYRGSTSGRPDARQTHYLLYYLSSPKKKLSCEISYGQMQNLESFQPLCYYMRNNFKIKLAEQKRDKTWFPQGTVNHCRYLIQNRLYLQTLDHVR